MTNPRDREQKNIFFMPMGLFPLASTLKKNAVDAEIIHLDLEEGRPIQEILDFSTLDAIGFDCHWLNQGLVVMETAELIKKQKPGVFIFLGGFTASLFAEEIMIHYPQIDAVIRGDGEIPIVELCKALHEEKKHKSLRLLANVQNLAWRKDKDNNEIRFNDFSYVAAAKEMEKLDFAAVDLLRNWQLYRACCTFWTHFEPFKSTPFFLLETGRGCQYACVFCGGNCEAQKRMNNRKHTVMRSVDSVIGTIKKAISFGFETFYSCMEFEGSDDWYIQLFNRLKEENIVINFLYGCWRLPSKSLIDALSQSCNQVLLEISPETSNIELRKRNKDMRLFYTNEQLEECLDYINHKSNIKVQLYFGYYLAADTKETIFGTVHFAVRMLIKYSRLLEIEYSNFSTDPGSLLFFYPEKYDIDINVRNFNDYMKYLKEYYQEKKGQSADMILFSPKSISVEENAEIGRKMMVFNYLFSCYSKSLSYILLEKAGNPDFIMELIEQADTSLTAGNKFLAHKTRNLLLESCKKKNILDGYLANIIRFECDKQDLKQWQSTGSYSFYLDSEIEKIKAELDDYSAEFNEGKGPSFLSAASNIPTKEDIVFDLD